ncbi:WD repeat and FYVE domain-containing protein 3 [Cichlidogyrus casuarinus]|uniref:WD repeat and FYVE domain-containing protein 3 n=1 Tax=Cichlidogyrus casuarinus TaxID=1844966 RepID=A0ABD2Q3A0_9PLAT
MNSEFKLVIHRGGNKADLSQSSILWHLRGLVQASLRNRQASSEANMIACVLGHYESVLIEALHPLFPPLHKLFEAVASQSIEPRELRKLLRLGNPLSCKSIDVCFDLPSDDLIHQHLGIGRDTLDTVLPQWLRQNCNAGLVQREFLRLLFAIHLARSRSGQHISVVKVNTLIRTLCNGGWNAKCVLDRAGINRSVSFKRSSSIGRKDSVCTGSNAMLTMSEEYMAPPFVELDESFTGPCYLFLPSIGPQDFMNRAAVAGKDDSANARGGIGMGERNFPPVNGFTFSSWLLVKKMEPTATVNLKPSIRLLTVVRDVQGTNNQMINLSVYLSSDLRSLVVSTQEIFLKDLSAQQLETDSQKLTDSASVAVFSKIGTSKDLDQWPLEQWRHLALVFNRTGFIQHSTCSLFLDSRLVSTLRLLKLVSLEI